MPNPQMCLKEPSIPLPLSEDRSTEVMKAAAGPSDAEHAQSARDGAAPPSHSATSRTGEKRRWGDKAKPGRAKGKEPSDTSDTELSEIKAQLASLM
ncbi:hypothetical protein ElyMa_000403400 [Elysia marginata]|uniref:Uncharacterized protein n=1 Tax=Elysia marginata TaxID=1093978 RepID=A0AAV4FKV5_9GAST|nr:hypothetical protein ElyMa_000403400 [Elysia marginata]